MKRIELRPSVQLFAEEIEKSVKRHDYKPEWENTMIPLYRCMESIVEEAIEVQEAIDNYSEAPSEENARRIMEECGDLGHSAHIVFSKIHPIAQNPKRGYEVK